MFGTASLGRYRRTTPEQLQTGRQETFGRVVTAIDRAIAAGRFRPGDPFLIAHQWWSAIHGYIMLEIAGFIVPPAATAKVLRPTLETIFVGLGDSHDQAERSLDASIPPTAAVPTGS